jgi:hypothetical protein
VTDSVTSGSTETDLHYLSALEALRLFRSRELSPVELMSASGAGAVRGRHCAGAA